MSDPTRLIDQTDGESRELAELVKVARKYGCSREKSARTYWIIRERLSEVRPLPMWSRLRLPWGWAGAAIAAAVLIGVFAAERSNPGAPAPARSAQLEGSESPVAGDEGWSRYVIAELGDFEADAQASLSFRDEPDARTIALSRGRLRADIAPQSPMRPVVVTTPHLRVVVLGTRFDVEVEGDVTRVHLLHGRVRVESAWGAVTLEAGESLDSNDPRLRPAAVTTIAAASPAARSKGAASSSVPENIRRAGKNDSKECESLVGRERLTCLRSLAAGVTLAAQSSLYELGLALRESDEGEADDAFKRLVERFPRGLLAPEAMLRRLELAQKHGAYSEVERLAEEFEGRFGADARLGQVLLIAAKALCGENDAARLSRLLDRLDRREESEIRSAAKRLRSRCVPMDRSAGP